MGITKLCCPVIELRRYDMKPGRREELIDLFEEHFVAGQEKDGIRVIGQFRDRNNADRFVWMRALPAWRRDVTRWKASTAGPFGERTERPPMTRWPTRRTCCC